MMYVSNAYAAALATVLSCEPQREPNTQKTRRHESTQRRKRTRRTGSEHHLRNKRKSRDLRKGSPFENRGRTIYNANSYCRQRSVSPTSSSSSASSSTILNTEDCGSPARTSSEELSVSKESWDRQGWLRGAFELYSEENMTGELVTETLSLEEKEMFALFINMD
ncbi:hypothetical protein PM082_002715 [Marasmius tenuissimus]|nr:hypothetical protein PM082_002715 [Marasmius tenuissimus]